MRFCDIAWTFCGVIVLRVVVVAGTVPSTATTIGTVIPIAVTMAASADSTLHQKRKYPGENCLIC
jgi:hypothetical protein